MPTPPKKYTKPLDQCETADERVALVRKAMEDGHSYKSAAVALSTTKGTVAGICFKKKISSTHPSWNEPKPVRPQRLKMAASEATQCTERINGGRRCGYERVEGLDKCGLHCGRRVKRA